MAERFGCSVATVFHKIREGIDADVDTRNAQRREAEGSYRFSTVAKDNYVLVWLEGIGVIPNRRRKFVQNTNGVITALDDEDKEIVSATLTLNDAGECRLLVKGQEKEFWQFRRMVLEGLLFGQIFPSS